MARCGLLTRTGSPARCWPLTEIQTRLCREPYFDPQGDRERSGAGAQDRRDGDAQQARAQSHARAFKTKGALQANVGEDERCTRYNRDDKTLSRHAPCVWRN